MLNKKNHFFLSNLLCSLNAIDLLEGFPNFKEKVFFFFFTSITCTMFLEFKYEMSDLIILIYHLS